MGFSETALPTVSLSKSPSHSADSLGPKPVLHCLNTEDSRFWLAAGSETRDYFCLAPGKRDGKYLSFTLANALSSP